MRGLAMLRLLLSRILSPLMNQRGSATALIILFDRKAEAHPGSNLLLNIGDNLLLNTSDAMLLN